MKRTKFLQVIAACGAPALFVLLTSCSSAQERSEGIIQPADTTVPNIPLSYEQKIDAFSAGETEYAGLYNTFEFRATLINAPVRDAILGRQGEVYQWDANKQTEERNKAVTKALSETDVYLNFYTPDRKNDNLADAKSIWMVYLEAGGARYAGKVVRSKQLFSELQSIYPYNNRWGTPYYVSFPISVNSIETQPSKLTITGPLGTRAVNFSALR